MKINDNPTDLQCFLCYFRDKIDSGVRQVDVANSALVNRSSSYINKIYLKDPKKIPIEFQESIAEFFGTTLGELLERGREIYVDIHCNPQNGQAVISRREGSSNLEDMIYDSLLEARRQSDRLASVQKNQEYLYRVTDHCGIAICIYDESFSVIYQNKSHRSIFGGSGSLLQKFDDISSREDFWGAVQSKTVASSERFGGKSYRVTHSGISGPKETSQIIETVLDVTDINKELEEVKQRIDFLSVAFNIQNENLAIFDDERRLVYFSRRFRLFDDLNIDMSGVKMEELIFALRSKIVDFALVEKFLDRVSLKEKSDPLIVEFKNGIVIEFQVVPLFRKEKYLGTLVSAQKLIDRD